MYELYPYFTNDGSVGLFSPEADDIYHSTYGALSEAYEKFIVPSELETFLQNKNEIKVLDVCYGIGYNTKSFLNFLFEKEYLKFSQKNKNNISEIKNNIDSIYTNNNFNKESIYTIYSNNNSNRDSNKNQCNLSSKCNYTIDVNNISSEIQHDVRAFDKNLNNSADEENNSENNLKIYIKALDIDENLFYLSPFFRQGNADDKKHNKLNFHYDKISKLLNNDFFQKYQIKPEISALIFDNIIRSFPNMFANRDISRILGSKQYKPFFDKAYITKYMLLRGCRSKYSLVRSFYAFLHNIYYKYLSKRYKRGSNSLILNDFIFEPIVGDARASMIDDKNIYDYIFLDAFTPAKCPALWSLEFFKLLYQHLDEDGMILTYSNSAAIRNAMLNAGFYVGKIYSDEYNKFTGTIAVKNKLLIKYELSEYDLGLVNSKAGIFYRDENLNSSNEQIIAHREKEVLASDKISSSRFIKGFRSKNNV